MAAYAHCHLVFGSIRITRSICGGRQLGHTRQREKNKKFFHDFRIV
jgi:hypothetical protein